MHPDERREEARGVGLDSITGSPTTAKGGLVFYNAANDGIGVSPFYEAASKLPADIQTKIDAALAGMKDGSLVTCPPKCGKTPGAAVTRPAATRAGRPIRPARSSFPAFVDD